MRLMIGFGNPLRCDDGLGPHLAETLGDGWHVLTPTQLMPELAEPISRARRVVFIDAGVGDRPGEVISRGVKPMPASGAFSHNVTPASLLAASRDLYGAAPDAILITITGAGFGLSETFSPFIATRLPQITAAVREMVSAFSDENEAVGAARIGNAGDSSAAG